MSCKNKDFLSICAELDKTAKFIEKIIRRKLLKTIERFPKLRVVQRDESHASKIVEIRAIVLDEFVFPFVRDGKEIVILSEEGIFYIPGLSFGGHSNDLGAYPDWDTKVSGSIYYVEYGLSALVKMQELEFNNNCKCKKNCFYPFFNRIKKFFIMWRIAREAYSQK